MNKFITLFVVSLYGEKEFTLRYRITKGTRAILDDLKRPRFPGGERIDTADLPMMTGAIIGGMAIGTSVADARRALVLHHERHVLQCKKVLEDAQTQLMRARDGEFQ